MKIKIPLTDKFLWMLYDSYEKTGEILEPPEIFKLKPLREAGALDAHYWSALETKRQRRQFAQFVNHLKRKGYIKIAILKNKKGILLSPKGKEKALRVKYSKVKPEGLKKRKDRKWVMVIFDIPEKKRKYRNDFRSFLYSLGFQKLQKSVWISPYNISKQLEEVIRVYRIDSYIRIFLIEEVEV